MLYVMQPVKPVHAQSSSTQHTSPSKQGQKAPPKERSVVIDGIRIPPEYQKVQQRPGMLWQVWNTITAILFYPWVLLFLAIFAFTYISTRLRALGQTRSFIRARQAELNNPLDDNARFQLADRYYKQRRYRRALRYLEEAYEIQKKTDFDPQLLLLYGNILIRQRRAREALPLLEKALDIDPSGCQGDVFLALGRAHRHQDAPEQASTWLRKAMRANGSLAEPVARLAFLLQEQGQGDEAKALVKDFLSDASRLPKYIRKRNRWWVWMLRGYPLTGWLLPY